MGFNSGFKGLSLLLNDAANYWVLYCFGGM